MADRDAPTQVLVPDPKAAPPTIADAISGEGSSKIGDGPAPEQRLDDDFVARYETRAIIGQGGMGEVRLCRDHRVGRDVALKVVRGSHGSHADHQSRFLREARVQGQLEHPAIVPVYDLGRDPSGTTYFTMKRVRGQTLADVVEALVAESPAAVQQYTRRRLLTAFTPSA